MNYGCGASTTRTQLTTSTTGRYSVQNGDFESGFTSGVGNQWTKGIGSGTFAQSTSIKRDGTSSQKITDALGGDAFTAWMYQKLNVQPNKNYTVKVYHRRAVTSGCVVEIGISYNGGVTADFDRRLDHDQRGTERDDYRQRRLRRQSERAPLVYWGRRNRHSRWHRNLFGCQSGGNDNILPAMGVISVSRQYGTVQRRNGRDRHCQLTGIHH